MPSRNNILRMLEASSSSRPSSTSDDSRKASEAYSLKDMIAEASRNRAARSASRGREKVAARRSQQQPVGNDNKRAQQPTQQTATSQNTNPAACNPSEAQQPTQRTATPQLDPSRPLQHLPDHEILAMLGRGMGLPANQFGAHMTGFPPSHMRFAPQQMAGILPFHQRMMSAQQMPLQGQQMPLQFRPQVQQQQQQQQQINAQGMFKNLLASQSPPHNSPQLQPNLPKKPEEPTVTVPKKPEDPQETAPTKDTSPCLEPSTSPSELGHLKEKIIRQHKELEAMRERVRRWQEAPCEIKRLQGLTIRQQDEIEILRHQLKKCQDELILLKNMQRQQAPQIKPQTEEREVVSDAEEEQPQGEYSLAELLKRRLAKESQRRPMEESTRERKRPRTTGPSRGELLARWGLREDPVTKKVEELSEQQPRRRSKFMQQHKNTAISIVDQEEPPKPTLGNKGKEEVVEIVDSDGEADGKEASATGEDSVAVVEDKQDEIPAIKVRIEDPTATEMEKAPVAMPAATPTAEAVPDIVSSAKAKDAEPEESTMEPSKRNSEQEVSPEVPISKATLTEAAERLRETMRHFNVVSPTSPCKKQKRLSLQEWKAHRKAAAEALKARDHVPSSTAEEVKKTREVPDDYMVV